MTPSNEQINDWLKAAEASPEPRFLIFATLAAEWGAKEEREACAMVCEGVSKDPFTKVGGKHAPYMEATAKDCADTIRARGQENKS